MNSDSRENKRREPTLPGIVEYGRVEQLTRDSSFGGAPECVCNANIVWSTFLPPSKDVTREQK